MKTSTGLQAITVEVQTGYGQTHPNDTYCSKRLAGRQPGRLSQQLAFGAIVDHTTPIGQNRGDTAIAGPYIPRRRRRQARWLDSAERAHCLALLRRLQRGPASKGELIPSTNNTVIEVKKC